LINPDCGVCQLVEARFLIMQAKAALRPHRRIGQTGFLARIRRAQSEWPLSGHAKNFANSALHAIRATGENFTLSRPLAERRLSSSLSNR
jgi:hypothetical protein